MKRNILLWIVAIFALICMCSCKTYIDEPLVVISIKNADITFKQHYKYQVNFKVQNTLSQNTVYYTNHLYSVGDTLK